MKQKGKEDGITVNIQIDGPMNDSVQVITPDVIAGHVVDAVKKAIKEHQPIPDHDCNKGHAMNPCITEWIEQEVKEVRKDREEASFNTKTYLDGLLRGYSNVLWFLKKRF